MVLLQCARCISSHEVEDHNKENDPIKFTSKYFLKTNRTNKLSILNLYTDINKNNGNAVNHLEQL